MTTRRALLLGAQTAGLRGVNDDVAAVDAVLTSYAFQRRVLTDHNATREGILDGIRALIHDTQRGDPVLLYYSGHGGRIDNPLHTHAHPHEPRHYTCIIPFDHTPSVFRGIFSAELSSLLAELSLRTANITVIVDCCHAATTVKGTLRSKGFELPWLDDVAAHREWLISQGYDLSSRAAFVESNPNAVRLLACASDQVAFEVSHDDGRAGGVFTTELIKVLSTTPPDTTWQAVASLVAPQVTTHHPNQAPEIHGPLGRVLFSTTSRPHVDVLALEEHDGQPYLSGGSLQGVTPRSRYLLMPPNANRPDRDLALAEAAVLAVSTDRARIVIGAHEKQLRVGTRAYLYDPSLERYPVRLDIPSSALRDALRSTLATSPRVFTAAPNERRPLATVALKEEVLLIIDDEGRLVRTPSRSPHGNLGSLGGVYILPVLEQLARVRALLDHPEPLGPARLRPPPTIQWGVLRDASKELLSYVGAELWEGDRVFLRVRSHAPSPVYVNILRVGVHREISLMTESQPTGVKLELGQAYTLGGDTAGLLPGIQSLWHGDVPRHAPQPMHLRVIISDRPVDLRSLESAAERSEHFARNLNDYLKSDVKPTTKDFGIVPQPRQQTRYQQITISFTLAPRNNDDTRFPEQA